MNKLHTFVLALCALAVLPSCRCKKTCPETCTTQEVKKESQKKHDLRVSGPLADKDVNWTDEDYK